MPIKTRNSAKNVPKQQLDNHSIDKYHKKQKTKKNKIPKHKYSYDQLQTQQSQCLKTTPHPLSKNINKLAIEKTSQNNLLQNKPLFKDLNKRIKQFSPNKVPSHFLDNLYYMLEKQSKSEIFSKKKVIECRKLLKKAQQNKDMDIDLKKIQKLIGLKPKNKTILKNTNIDVQINWKVRYDGFAHIIDWVLQYLQELNMRKCLFSCCNFIYLLFNSDIHLPQLKNKEVNSVKIHKYIITSILISTKFQQIYPPYLEDIISNVNQYISMQQIIKLEGIIFEMNQFSYYFIDNESVFVRIFSIIIDWNEQDTKFCQYILQSGLNNPQLYQQKPSYKALAAISAFQKMKYKTNKKTQLIRSIINIPYQKEIQIIKKYSKALEYNKINKIYTQKKKYFIFQDFKQMF